MNCQFFEDGIGVLLFYLGKAGADGIDPAKVSLILDGKEKKMCGQLIGMLKQHVQVSDIAEKLLSDALAARNRLIHRSLIDNAEKMTTDDGRKGIVKEIRELRATVLKAHELLEPLTHSLIHVVEGHEPEKAMQMAKAPLIVDMMQQACDKWDARLIKAFDLSRRIAGLASELDGVRSGTATEGREWERQLEEAWREVLDGDHDRAVQHVSEIVARIREWLSVLKFTDLSCVSGGET